MNLTSRLWPTSCYNNYISHHNISSTLSMFFGCGLSSPKVLKGLEPEEIAKARLASPPKFDKTQYCPIPDVQLIHPLDRPDETQPGIPEVYVHAPDLREKLPVIAEAHTEPSDQLRGPLPIILASNPFRHRDARNKRMPRIRGVRLRTANKLDKRLPTIPEADHLTLARLQDTLPSLPHERHLISHRLQADSMSI